MLCDRISDCFIIFTEAIFWYIEAILCYFVKIILEKRFPWTV